METVHPYILDNASTAEYQRLDLMSKILDPRTRASLGVHVLACAMAGTVSNWAAATVA